MAWGKVLKKATVSALKTSLDLADKTGEYISVSAQVMREDIKEKTPEVVEASKALGSKTVHGVKEVSKSLGSKTVHGVKVASKATWQGTVKGCELTGKVLSKSAQYSKEKLGIAAEHSVEGIKKTSETVAHSAKVATKYTKEKLEVTAEHTVEGMKKTSETVSHSAKVATKFTKEKLEVAADISVEGMKKTTETVSHSAKVLKDTLSDFELASKREIEQMEQERLEALKKAEEEEQKRLYQEQEAERIRKENERLQHLMDTEVHRKINNGDIRKEFLDLVNNATTEIDIISPWIGEWVFYKKKLFYWAIKKKLKEGVIVKIRYGISRKSSDSETKDILTEENAQKLKDELSEFGDIRIYKTNTHEKIILFDDQYCLVGSINILSNDGVYRKGRERWDESCVLITSPKLVADTRAEKFDF